MCEIYVINPIYAMRDEQIVIGAAQAVLDKYGADNDLSDLLWRAMLQQLLTAFANS